MINWNLFDKIYCVHYLPYKERFEDIKSELSRVSLLEHPNFEFYYTVPNDYYNWIFMSSKNFKNNSNVKYNKISNIDIYPDCPEATNSDIDFRFINNTNINLLINMMDLLNDVKNFGYKRILILEDDVRFLKDLDKLETYINNIPLNYNIINFDPFIYKLEDYKPTAINELYTDISKSPLYNASMVSLDTKAVNYVIKKQKEMSLPWDNYISYKSSSDDSLLRCIPNTNLCIQMDYNERQEYYYTNTKDSKYINMTNLNMEDYNYELANV